MNGTAIFTKAKVKLNAVWPDYVFNDDHKLQSLKDLEDYINTYNHLPEIPTENEVKEDGIDLGDNQTLLLKKIEELTLYLIEQNKQQQNNQSTINTLIKKVEEQEITIKKQQIILSEIKDSMKVK